jgi:hypothetical protein
MRQAAGRAADMENHHGLFERRHTQYIFNPLTGKFIGKLRDQTGAVIAIDLVFGLAFGNGSAAGGPAKSLSFSSGSNGGGIFGSIAPIQNIYGISY